MKDCDGGKIPDKHSIGAFLLGFAFCRRSVPRTGHDFSIWAKVPTRKYAFSVNAEIFTQERKPKNKSRRQ